MLVCIFSFELSFFFCFFFGNNNGPGLLRHDLFTPIYDTNILKYKIKHFSKCVSTTQHKTLTYTLKVKLINQLLPPRFIFTTLAKS